MKDITKHRYYKHFMDICAIPHGSGNEKGISDHVVRFAQRLGLEVHQDAALNVVVKKPGTAGYESAPAVVLQCHLDMVCEKDPGVEHNFETDPIQVEIVDGCLTAKGTTLGADNGIGICYILCVLEDDNLAHPPIEAVFTSNEEVGMEGMQALDLSLLRGRRMLNLDCGPEGVLITSCAGGVRYELEYPVQKQKAPTSSVCYCLSVSGLTGGHSGADIHTGRANSILLLSRLLGAAFAKYPMALADLNGGEKDNSIPAYARAALWVHKEDETDVQREIAAYTQILHKEYGEVEPHLSIVLEPWDGGNSDVLTVDCMQTALALIQLAPLGAFLYSPREKGAVISSANLGNVRLEQDKLTVSGLIRGNMDSKIDETLVKLQYLAALAGAKLTAGNAYPAWEYRPDSPLRDRCVALYKELYDKDMTVASVHGGLECALMAGRCPDMDMVAIGPNLHDCHSPSERVEVDSLLEVYDYLCKLLAGLQT